MGWTTLYREPGLSHKQFLQKEFRFGDDLLACAAVDKVIYAAVKVPENNKVIALVILTAWYPKSHFNFGYKDMDESMGPIASKCPDTILDLLSPPEHDYAIAWRERCREYNRVIKENKAALKKVHDGVVIKFAEMIEFTTCARDTFLVKKQRGRFHFFAHDQLVPRTEYQIHNWRQRKFEVIS